MDDEPNPRVLTLYEPWATLIRLGLKRVETRPWRTEFRGNFYVHAAKRRPDTHTIRRIDAALADRGLEPLPKVFPFGKIVARVRLANCVPTDSHPASSIDPNYPTVRDYWAEGTLEREFGDYRPGRFAFVLADFRTLRYPPDYVGSQGFRELPERYRAGLESAEYYRPLVNRGG